MGVLDCGVVYHLLAKGSCEQRKKEAVLVTAGISEKSKTEYICVPDTVDPRGPKGKSPGGISN